MQSSLPLSADAEHARACKWSPVMPVYFFLFDRGRHRARDPIDMWIAKDGAARSDRAARLVGQIILGAPSTSCSASATWRSATVLRSVQRQARLAFAWRFSSVACCRSSCGQQVLRQRPACWLSGRSRRLLVGLRMNVVLFAMAFPGPIRRARGTLCPVNLEWACRLDIAARSSSRPALVDAVLEHSDRAHDAVTWDVFPRIYLRPAADLLAVVERAGTPPHFDRRRAARPVREEFHGGFHCSRARAPRLIAGTTRDPVIQAVGASTEGAVLADGARSLAAALDTDPIRSGREWTASLLQLDGAAARAGHVVVEFSTWRDEERCWKLSRAARLSDGAVGRQIGRLRLLSCGSAAPLAVQPDQPPVLRQPARHRLAVVTVGEKADCVSTTASVPRLRQDI